MRVRAVKEGFYQVFRKVGDVFEIPDEPKGEDGKPALFSDAHRKPGKTHRNAGWMEQVDVPAPASKKADKPSNEEASKK